MADLLRREPDTDVELIDGSKGELTVLIDGHAAYRKQGEQTPEPEQIATAVKDMLPAAATH